MDIKYWSLILRLLLIASLLPIQFFGVADEQKTARISVVIDFSGVDIPLEMQVAITQAVEKRPGDVLPGQSFAMVSAKIQESWALGTLAALDRVLEDVGMNETGALILLHKVNEEWFAFVEGTDSFAQKVVNTPDSLLSQEGKQYFSSARQDGTQQTLASMKFPWDSGQSWKLSQGWHSGNHIDMAPSGSEPNMWVLAAHSGTVTRVCNGPASANVQVAHSDGTVTTYTHLDKNSIPSNILGTTIPQGRIMGTLFRGVYNPGKCGSNNQWWCTLRDSCGYSTGPHVHFGLPSQTVTLDGWTGHSDNTWTRGGETKRVGSWFPSSNVRNTGAECPTSGGILLYKHWRYDCGGEGEGSGWIRRDTGGLQDVPASFDNQASSVRVPAGWSVKLYEHTGGGGGSTCRTANDDDFSGDVFDNGTLVNDHISSFEVFTNLFCGVNQQPNPPTLLSPPDGFVSQTGLAPTLCWSGSDPNGDPLTYRVEVWSGNGIYDTVDGLAATCWRPTQIDWRAAPYDWLVTASDGQLFSSMSAIRRFYIEIPNTPPAISFNTANGNTFPSGRIDTRERNWTLAGTASDTDGSVAQVNFNCSGDNCGYQAGHNGTTSWLHVQNDLSGRNDISFIAVDNQGASTTSRHLDLRVDLAAPATALGLNNETNPIQWPLWFTTPVTARLQATDGATGGARSGIYELRYRLDGGGWQSYAGSDLSLSIHSDGPHSLEYYAVDNVGNIETSHMVSFQIDQAAPAPITGLTEIHGAVSGQWQNTFNTPTFTWNPSSDPTSGVWGYQFYFGDDPAGIGYQTFLAGDPLQWTPLPAGARTGSYYLRGQVRDIAGNWSGWVNLFTFRYDAAPPENPVDVTHAAGITTTWQSLTSQAAFNWPPPHDEGSGIQGYYAYWGTDMAGISTNFITTADFQSPAPLCNTGQACMGYLRLRSVDNVNNQAEDWSTAFTLRYDAAPPVVDFSVSGDVTMTNQTLVTLEIAGSDQGSGVRAMRLSSDGETWTPWEVYAPQRLWTIPAIGRQWWPIYLQVRDGVGLESPVVMHEIYFDVNARQPKSANFWLLDHQMNSGAGAYASASYEGRGTLGQTIASNPTASTHFTLIGGYEAGSQALPLTWPSHDEFDYVNGILASGTGATTITSTAYIMWGVLGEPALPVNTTTVQSASFQHQPGFLAAHSSQATPTPTPTPGPTPTPEPPLACEFPRISINQAALFTNNTAVTLDLCAPYAVEMMLSNDGGFGGAQWEPYAETKNWTLTSYGPYVLPRFVYAAFRDANGTIHSTYFDDIILDPNPPAAGGLMVGDPVGLGNKRLEGFNLVKTRTAGTVDLFVSGRDDNSGMAEMQFSSSPDFSGATWEPFSALKPWAPAGEDGLQTVYARLRDSAGNLSEVMSATFMLDSNAPWGGVVVVPRIVGLQEATIRVYFGWEDNLSGVSDMRVGMTPDFADVPWEPFTYTLDMPISPTLGQPAGVFYVQYRDLAGNPSAVYSTTYTVDDAPPQLAYAGVEPGDGLERTLIIHAYDEDTGVSAVRLSNDPFMIEGTTTIPYTETVAWILDERRVVWIQISDGVGNWSSPYPVYGGDAQLANPPVYLPLILKQP